MRYYLGSTLLAICVATPLANAAIIVAHSADANPMAESPAWAGNGGGTGETVLGVNDSGTKAWQITDTSASNNLYYTRALPGATSSETGWTATASMRVAANGYDSANPANSYSAMLYIFDGTYDVALTFVGTAANPANDGLWYVGTGGVPVQLFAFDTATAYHTYQFIYNPSQSDRYAVYIDGKNVGAIMRSNIPVFSTTPLIGFGSVAGVGSSDWNSVSFETGQVVAPQIGLPQAPEPASLGLLSIGGAALLARRRRA